MPTTRFTVTATSWITPSLRRVSLRTDDLSGFTGSVFTDRYVKLVFPKPGVEYPDQIDVRELRGTMAPEDLPVVRTYTALHPDVASGTLDIDFVVHGDDGTAGPWAAAAEIGDTLLANGPGGAYRPDPEADWHLLVGDESAVPAMTAALEVLPTDAVAHVIVLIESEEYEPHLPAPAGAAITFVHRNGGTGDGLLTAAVRALEWPGGRVHAFVHGEAQEVMRGVRPYLRSERGLQRDQLSISGYWRRGESEEGFREWKSEFARAEDD
ncbi:MULTISPECIES: siderophore-interacting protein [unclassified Leifsonia]|uniref:siderophore-interacting protein n=1 Tax=unclassified Leifsonia TaxID=2663824 RepID=UPI0006F823F4|nr:MULTISPECIES: siderophore-interacting protein [unclassified Leifsonia]KQX07274.1 siderophore utilization protein [Leifsonia sp. Root1293]KRA11557.1 siderophore utilization protein [Leifsonia sp. Root60]